MAKRNLRHVEEQPAENPATETVETDWSEVANELSTTSAPQSKGLGVKELRERVASSISALNTLPDAVNESDSEASSAPVNLSDLRQFPRVGVIWPGTLMTDIETIDCTVLNISANGAKLDLKSPMTTDNWEGTLDIPCLGIIRAKVAWLAPEGVNQIGVTLLDPTDVVESMLANALPNSRIKYQS